MAMGVGEVKPGGRLLVRGVIVSFPRLARGQEGVRYAMTALFWLLDRLLSLYIWAVILAAVFSTLASFNVLDTRNRVVWTIGDFLYRVTDPALRPIRNLLPNFGGIDISPIILLLILQAARMLLAEIAVSAFGVFY
jgi:YggT family protein